jgi:hypothetical protein
MSSGPVLGSTQSAIPGIGGNATGPEADHRLQLVPKSRRCGSKLSLLNTSSCVVLNSYAQELLYHTIRTREGVEL